MDVLTILVGLGITAVAVAGFIAKGIAEKMVQDAYDSLNGCLRRKWRKWKGKEGDSQTVVLAPAQVPSPLQQNLIQLAGLADAQLDAMLLDEKREHTEFFQKYVNEVFFKREATDEAFARFLRQGVEDGKRCFLVSGKAGKGKTNLLCHLAESRRPNFLPVLLSASELRLAERDLSSAVVRRLFERSEYALQAAGISLTALAKHVTAMEGGIVVFVDGINELDGRDARDLFNSQLDELILSCRLDNSRLFFCLSCRSEIWHHFKMAPWAQYHVLREGRSSASTEPTLELGDFREEDIDHISRAYFHWYGLETELRSNARRSCCDPLMLRYLCAAYTKRSPKDKTTPPEQVEKQKLDPIHSLRRKEVFDAFVKNRRESMYKAAQRALRQDDARLIAQYTTSYLITMAYRMFEKRRAYLTVDEVIAIAHELDHPDRRLADEGREVFLRDDRSIFFQLVDEGIILSKHTEDSISFTFETYFEYSLGRYLVQERWSRLAAGPGKESAVIEDFRTLITEHKTLSDEDNFHNLFGACSFAILELEQSSEPLGKDVGALYPTLFIRLIETMAGAAKEGLDWIQLACSTIRETVLAQPSAWQIPDGKRAPVEKRFDLVMEVLEALASTSEWLVLWDLEETLLALATANFDRTLRHVRVWAEEGTGLQPIFGIQALLRLSANHPQEVLDLLLGLARASRFQEDFWLARTLVAAARSLGDPGRGSRLPSPDRDNLRKVLYAYAMESPVATIRGVALAALPFVTGSRDLPAIQERVKAEPWPWALWNLAFELQEWSRKDDLEWLWNILDLLADRPHEHVRYAVDCALARFKEVMPENRFKDINHRLRENRWRKDSPASWKTGGARIGIVYSPAFLEPAYDNHVECRERIQVIIDKLERVAANQFSWIEPREASSVEVGWAHNPEKDFDRHRDRSPWPRYLEDVIESSRLRQAGGSAQRLRSGPSELRFESYEAALLSAGGVLHGVDFVLENDALAAFAINRPPGHLANNMICIFNNVAIAAQYARGRRGLNRIFILDFDAHHGSHTYRVFRRERDVIYFSIHQEGNYAAEEGLIEDTGKDEGEGFTFNITYPLTMGDDGYACIVESLLEPVMREWKPDLILLSAGYDGHFDDPLTRGRLSERAYIHLAERLRGVALDLGIKVVATLEGGYGLEGMSNSLIHMLRIFGDWPTPPEAIGYTPRPDGFVVDEEEGVKQARESVRQRVKLMAELKAQRPNYPFDLDRPHWRAILESEPASQG